MLPGIGGSELVVIAIVALIVVGPRDLPKLLRQIGRFVGRMRNMAADFRASFDDMARQSELDELRKEVESLRTGKLTGSIVDDVNTQMRGMEHDINANIRRPIAQPPSPVSEPPAEPMGIETPSQNEENAMLRGDPPAAGIKPVPRPRTRKSATTPKEVATEVEPQVEVVPAPRRRRRSEAS